MLDHQLTNSPQLGRIIWQGFEELQHRRNYTDTPEQTEQKTESKPMLYWKNGYPAVSGFHVFKGARQSIPSSSIAS